MEKVIRVKFLMIAYTEFGCYMADGTVDMPEGREAEPLTEAMMERMTNAVTVTFKSIDKDREEGDKDGEWVDNRPTDEDIKWN